MGLLLCICYIKKSKPLLEFEEKFRTHMFNLHQIYKKKPEGQGKIITKTDVITLISVMSSYILKILLSFFKSIF